MAYPQDKARNTFGPGENLDEIDLAGILRSVWNGKFYILASAFVAMLCGAYYAYQIAQPIYRATAIVEFTPRESNLVDIKSIVSGETVTLASVNTTIEFIQSREMMEKLVRDLNLIESGQVDAEDGTESFSIKEAVKGALSVLGIVPPPVTRSQEDQADIALRNAVNKAADAISVTLERDTYLLSITASASTAEMAAMLANTLADNFIAAERERTFELTKAAIDWLTSQMLDIESRLKEKENQVAQLRLTSSVVSEKELEIATLRLKELRDRQTDRQEQLVALQGELEEARAAIASRDKTAILMALRDSALNRLGSQIGSTVSEEDTLFLQRASDVLELRETAINRIETELDALSSSITELYAQLEKQSEEFQKLGQLEQELAVTQDLYRTFQTGLQETTVQVGLVKDEKRIMSRALEPLFPASPRRMRLIVMFAFLGVCAGVAFLLISEMLRRGTIRSGAQLEQVAGLPLLGETLATPRQGRKDVLAYFRNNPTSAAAEAVRNLRTTILMSDKEHRQQVITVTSSIPGEGKTTLSLLLAMSLARVNAKVLLIEGDIRRRTISQYVSAHKAAGSLKEALAGEAPLDTIVCHDADLGADILFGAKLSDNPADIYSSPAFDQLIASCRKLYDHVIIDTPPVLVVPDARVIARNTDALVYISKWDTIHASQVQEGIRQFESVGIRPTGVVLSMVNPKGMKRYGYGGRYGAYSRYGASYYI